MASVTKDEQAWKDAKRSLEGLRLGVYIPRLAQLVAAGGVKLTMDTFKKQSDPYGRPWAPLSRIRTSDKRAAAKVIASGRTPRGGKILIKTARMRNSTAPISIGRSGGVGLPVFYASVHQNGATIAPHTRASSYSNVTYRVGGRFASEKAAAKAHRSGKAVRADRFKRVYSQGIKIPQRMMLPDKAMGLPASWNTMIRKETVGLMTRWVLKGARA